MIFLKWTGIALLWLATESTCFALVLLAKPAWFLNDRTVAWSLHHFGKRYSPRWKDLKFGVESRRLLDKEFSIHLNDFCVRAADLSLRGCIRSLNAQIEVVAGLNGLRELRVRRLVVDGEPAFLKPKTAGGKAPATKRRRLGKVALPSIAGKIRLGQIRIALPFEIDKSSASSLRASLDAHYDRTERDALVLRLEGERREGKKRAPFRLHAVGRLSGVPAKERGAQTLSIIAHGEAPQGVAFAAFQLAESASGYEASGRLALEPPKGPLRRISLTDCRLSAPFNSRSVVTRAQLSCRALAQVRSYGESPYLRQFPKDIHGRLSANAALGSRRIKARGRLKLEPGDGWFAYKGGIEARLDGETSGLARSKLAYSLDMRFRVARLKKLVAFLDGTPLAVPAPLRDMDGATTLDVTGEGNLTAARARLRFATDYAGKRQRFRLEASAAAQSSNFASRPPAATVNADLVLQEIALELPFLKLQPPPPFKVDPRIKTGEPGENPPAPPPAQGQTSRAAGSVKLSARVRTLNQPVLLRTNLIKDAIPFTVDVKLQPGRGLAGNVSVHRFNLELFRRTAAVDHINLLAHAGSQQLQLDGLLRYKTADATIDILLLGSTAKPRIELLSDPPMSRQEILALLLYGRAPTALDPDESTSVGNMDAALTRQAFGLASLFLFGSTPIENVSYNPESQSYSVKLRLPAGASLEVASDFQQSRELRIRKRLARHWAVSSELGGTTGVTTTTPSQQSNSVQTFLEWFNRY